jgi:hypothetical protein
MLPLVYPESAERGNIYPVGEILLARGISRTDRVPACLLDDGFCPFMSA